LKSIRDLIAELREIWPATRSSSRYHGGTPRSPQAYGDDRRTQIVDKVDEIKLEDLIADTDMLITVSHAGYIKRTPVRFTAPIARRQGAHRRAHQGRGFR